MVQIQQQVKSERISALLQVMMENLNLIGDDELAKTDPMKVFNEVHKLVRLLVWALSGELSIKNSLSSISTDEYRIQKSYDFWNSCS